ncbi:hypothetical protein GUITHDRAFT_103818 [Guillardia theta CCMP2712]|uniref:Phosphotyrosine protein phosphatase I domain-containing protein n=2 Tax=Guillardia theta TaxID=55529 RepID=L1JR72_GUITC|nr:hypothetical protein GUITHDRAFT_103818 [Guillardia theta CCMP2712]EKX50593.1 hypothetical protein GUITHDRAFT_103818 [Guillardia theta CCMP2712]|eukprot:XP_005837573.1 hypothetical protein GUITHDRAFT_103818 [Guillardia theta CCMP2712]
MGPRLFLSFLFLVLNVPSTLQFVLLPALSPSSSLHSAPSRRCMRSLKMSRRAGQGREGPGEAGERRGFQSPQELIRQWKATRRFDQDALTISGGSSRTFIPVLFVSNMCYRALLAERLMTQIIQRLQAPPSSTASAVALERLLVLSAGLRNAPGEAVPLPLIASAAEKGIDLTHTNPRAAFSMEDLDNFDFLVCMDDEIRDTLLELATQSQTASYDTYEKKILSPRTLLANSPLSAEQEQQDGEETGGCEVKPFMAKEKLDEEKLSQAVPQLRQLCDLTVNFLQDIGLNR